MDRRWCVMIVFFLLALCVSLTAGNEAPTPVLTIMSPDGDVIDCINILDQPAFRHPLLKNHKLQKTPTNMVHKEESYGWQVWHATGARCPKGSIPIRRFAANPSHRVVPNAADMATRGHHYAVGGVISQTEIFGTKATLNVWDPIVESPDDFSLAQIWVASGSYGTGNLNTIEAGWQVYPEKYHDNQPRFFTFWTNNSYQGTGTGCYSHECEGFVQVSSTVALEAAFRPTSTFEGEQHAITLQIWKDQFTGHWWLAIGSNVMPVGYWPAGIFTTLFHHADTVEWGGEVLYKNSSGMTTKVQMGSGEFGDEGFRKAAYFCNIEIAEDNHTYLPVQNFVVKVTNPEWYTVKKSSTKECGNHFYYGGPGPVRSAAAPRVLHCIFFLFFAFLVVV